MKDVIGVVRSFSEVTTIVTKATQKELKKREINIVDSSNCAVNVTMWAKMVGFGFFFVFCCCGATSGNNLGKFTVVVG
jgi:hypothetical protein